MISITEDPIDVNKIFVSIKDRTAGATILFTGIVRDHNEIKPVSEIYYEAYQKMAENVLAKIEEEALKKWKITKFIAIHRTGNLKVGDVSVIVAVSSEHRKEAFQSCKYGIDSIKARVPIWKKEISDSDSSWVSGSLIQKTRSEKDV